MSFAQEARAASWLFLCVEEFAEMDGGLSFASVQAAVPEAANVVSDPPRLLDMELAKRQVSALDALPRPTLVTCRTGPRSSALIYLYAGLRCAPRPTRCWRAHTRMTRHSLTRKISRPGWPRAPRARIGTPGLPHAALQAHRPTD